MGRARLHHLGWLTLLVLAAGLAACTQTSGTARGVVLGVEGSLTEVTSFTVLVDGDQVRFVPAVDGEFGFPLPHLREHQRTGEPVVVGWELIDGVRYAVSVGDD